ncbi:cytochrome P450 [Prauserella shujinwangii]|uniref:cytochrome P450 n=1 Tax=Prauserella shujinwangii TaxID=1453103 RepID=UPI001FED16E7|nr:cytochrome P450 [Prauserella shujinwangii]
MARAGDVVGAVRGDGTEESAEAVETVALARGFDHQDPAVAGEIHDILGRFRRHCPVAFSEAYGGMHVVTRYADIRQVAQRGETFSSAVDLGAVVVVPEIAGVRAPLFELDLAEHTGWRRHLQRFFTPAAAARHEPYIRRVSREAVARIAPRGRADLVAEYAAVVPLLVVGELLGVPEPQRPRLAELARGLTTASGAEEAARVGRDYAEFLLGQIRDRRGRAGGDLLTSVVNTEINGRAATEPELLKFVFLMIAAGNLTTTDQLASALLVLAEEEGLRRRVAAAPELIGDLVEECVRHESAVAATGRAVVADTELGGVPLAAGDRVLITWGSGNRDEEHFPDGGEFRLGRSRPRKPHVGWGAGAHRCLGMHLARVELRVLLEELLAAIPEFRLEPGAAPERTYGVIRGVRSLPVTWPVPG